MFGDGTSALAVEDLARLMIVLIFAIMTSYAGNSDSALRGVSETGYRYFSRLARANPYGSRVPLDVIRRQKKEK